MSQYLTIAHNPAALPKLSPLGATGFANQKNRTPAATAHAAQTARPLQRRPKANSTTPAGNTARPCARVNVPAVAANPANATHTAPRRCNAAK
ncbi:MAG: hypothetical protein B9S35_14010, partial [Opitutia bacterium Tous-C5TDCM]